MKGELIKIAIDGVVTRKPLDSPPQLEELQKIVDGFIESIPYFDQFEGKPCVAFCNEEGKLEGLPLNRAATMLWTKPGDDFLCGNVAIIVGDEELLAEI